MKLNRILNTFNKTITQLDKFIQKSETEVEDLDRQVSYLKVEADSLSKDIDKAKTVKTKIEGLIS